MELDLTAGPVVCTHLKGPQLMACGTRCHKISTSCVFILKVCQCRRGDDILRRMGIGKVMIVSVQFYLVIICTFTCS